MPPWKRFAKRVFDLALSSVLLIFVFPLLPVLALIVKLSEKGPVFFCQERVGYLGRRFRVIKFRTMVPNAMELGGYATSTRDPRITSLGRVLRRWGLDELPQLWNVVRGEMSLVGPRPTLAYQVEAYSNHQKKRLLVRPGLSGLAQVSGRNQLTWPEKIELDIKYIENYSLSQDIKILFQTVRLLWSAEGVYGDPGF